MAFFTPSNQVRNMLDAEIGQALCGRPDVAKLLSLSNLANQVQHQQQNNLWVEDNWLDDCDAF